VADENQALPAGRSCGPAGPSAAGKRRGVDPKLELA
jgi:hypothetical protein